jgi:hypothetical protein
MTERRSYSRHGLNVVKAKVKVRGLAVIDRRTAAAQALLAWRSELLTDLGGEETVSAQQRALVEMATRTRLYIEHLDFFLMEQESLVNRKRRTVLPVLTQRQALVDSFSRLLGQLGLRRVPKNVPSLPEYIEQRYGPNGADEREGAREPGNAEESVEASLPRSSRQ